MRKEAYNSFAKGLQKDMSVLTTPKDSYTDCLNGTLITYNGNEMSLQNDMGNALVGTSYLSKGFVPVGMKEHGGIIYVASYNPDTKESEIGCFPSPLRLFVSSETPLEAITFSLDDILTKTETTITGLLNNVNIPYITNEHIIHKLFYNASTQEHRKFHIGDEFIVTAYEEDLNTLRPLILNNILTIELAVLTDSGTIEYVPADTLRTYAISYTESGKPKSWDFWIKPLVKETEQEAKLGTEPEINESVIVASIIKDYPTELLVFNASSSGRLMIVYKYRVYDQFLLYKLYTYDNGSIIANITGKADLSNVTLLGKLGLSSSPTVELADSIEIKESSGNTIEYTIMPASLYGCQQSLQKSGIIDFLNLRMQESKISGWSYYIHKDEVLINWQYDYFDFNNLEIDKVTIEFVDLSIALPENSNYMSVGPIFTATLTKEYYSGDFTEYIPFTDIKKNNLYLCRIYQHKGSNKELIGLEFLYTGTFFNAFSLEEFNALRSGKSNRPEVTVKVAALLDTKITPEYQTTKINKNKVHNSATNNLMQTNSSYSNVLALVDLLSWDDFSIVRPKDGDTYKFIANSSKQYTVRTKVTAEIEDKATYSGLTLDINSAFVGNLNTTISNISLAAPKNTVVDDIQYLGSDTSKTYLPKVNSTAASRIEGTTIITNVNTNRGIYGNLSPEQSKVVELERLMPVYDTISTYESDANRNKVFGFRDELDTLICITGNEDDIWANSTVSSESTKAGQSAGGRDDSSLSQACREMGGTVNIFGGQGGDEANFGVKGAEIDHINNGGLAWNNDFDNEIDPAGDFLLAVWKTAWARDQYKIVNIATLKNCHIKLSKSRPRVDMMLRCLLSLLLVAKTIKADISYITPNHNDFIYHSNYDTEIKTQCTVASPSVDNVFTLGNLGIDTIVNAIINEINITTSKGYKFRDNLKNYFPTFKVETPKSVDINYKVGSDINLDHLLYYYTTSFDKPDASISTLSHKHRQFIWVGKVESINKNGICKLKGDPVDGYEYIGKDINIDTINEDHEVFKKLYYWPQKIYEGSLPNTPVTVSSTPQLTLYQSINSMFINSANKDGLCDSPMELDYYNEILIHDKLKSNLKLNSYWYDGGIEPHAPDVLREVNLGKFDDKNRMLVWKLPT